MFLIILVPDPISLTESHPLVLNKYLLKRDVAWERSLSFGRDMVPTLCVITVDGFVLFYD